MGAEQDRSAAVHGGTFLAALWLVSASLPRLTWPWYMLLPLAAYGTLVMSIPPLRRTFPGLPAGRIGAPGLLAALALSLATLVALLAFHFLLHPDVASVAASFPHALFGNLVLAGICFSFGNALLEELLFRGILYEALAAEWGAAAAVLGSAAVFGLGHLNGYPPGPVGAVLAGLYGVALGLFRWWSGGLALGGACHMCADATIFGILTTTGAFAVEAA